MVGVAPGVKEGGGVMDIVTHALEVKGPAGKLPEHFEIDVSGLNVKIVFGLKPNYCSLHKFCGAEIFTSCYITVSVHSSGSYRCSFDLSPNQEQSPKHAENFSCIQYLLCRIVSGFEPSHIRFAAEQYNHDNAFY